MPHPPEHTQVANSSRLEAILESARLGTWDWWLDTNAVSYDRRWCEMLGLHPQNTPQLLSTWDERVHPDDKAKAYEDIRAHIEGRTDYYENSHRLRHENGSWIWVLGRGRISQRVDNKAVRFTGAQLDITAFKNAEEMSESIQKIAKIGGWELDVASKTTTWTTQTYRIHGIPPGTPTALRSGIEFYAPNERSRLAALVERCINGEPFRGTFEFENAQGRSLWVEAMGEPSFDARGQVTKLRGTFQDVTESVNSRQLARDQHAQLERLVRNSPGMVYQFCRELTGRMYFAYVSPQAFDIYELTPEDFAKNPSIMLEMADPEGRDGLHLKIDESFRNLAPFEWKGRIRTKSGALKWLMARSIPFAESNGSVTWDGLVVDITQEVMTSSSLELERAKSVQAAKLASLGEMAAGFAHEINNPLAIIDGTAQALSNFADDPEKLAQRVNTIIKATQRIAKIVSSLKKFSHSSSERAHYPAALRSAVNEAIILTDSKAKRQGVTVKAHASVEGRILCDEIEIEQVLVNLINNGIDAAEASEDPWVDVRLSEDDSSVVVRVCDSGPGIALENRDKIFQPFFTTKMVGSGTGLGLAIVKGILDDHGATIELRAKEPHTCFELRFKRAR